MMKPGRLFILFTLLATSRALAGAVVTLTPNMPDPYIGGENVLIDVFITPSETISPWYLQFDFSDTDSAIGVASQFTFNFTTLITGAFYSTFPELPTPMTVNTSQFPIAGFVLFVPKGVPFRAGSIMITMPEQPGNYLLDVLHHDVASSYEGAMINFDLSGRTDPWTSWNGGLSGGQRTFVVVPEPTMLVILALGIIPLARRRAANRREIA